jgi:hypothetical protein
MAKKTKRKAKGKRGRPTRRAASEKALKGVDLAAVDPRQILQAIAADTSAPATARLQAARALLNDSSPTNSKKDGGPGELDPVAQRALRIINGGKA